MIDQLLSSAAAADNRYQRLKLSGHLPAEPSGTLHQSAECGGFDGN